MNRDLPEILAPVADMSMCRAAVHSGADAIYVGMPGFNARGRAPSLAFEELREVIEYAHLYGLKVFVAFNVLIFERELTEILPALTAVLDLAPDAFIVQDLGLVRLIKQIAPLQTVHASTQMTVTCAEAIEITAALGIDRYVLGREVSIAEIEKIRTRTDKQLEVFVHGALCVAYSGQCLTSERAGGRSANRGQCAQSCRLPYDLIVDGIPQALGERRYLVSPKDLCALTDVPRLTELGIDSFKIEGRLKSPEYVASSVRSYKEALDGSLKNSEERSRELTEIYSRGFFNGWLDGVNHQELVDGRYGNHHGLELGRVSGVGKNKVTIASAALVKNGDGVVFADFKHEFEIGGPVYGVRRTSKDSVELELSRTFEIGRLKVGMSAFLNSSPSIEDKWRKSFSDKALEKRVPVSIGVRGDVGERLCAEYSDGQHVVTVMSQAVLAPARKAPITSEGTLGELAALSGTCFVLGSAKYKVKGQVFLHNKELKEMRRQAVKELRLARTQRPALARIEESDALSWLEEQGKSCRVDTQARSTVAEAAFPELSVLIRDAAQVESLRGLKLNTVYLDFEFGKEYGDSLRQLRELGFKVGIATTRILKPGERGHLEYIKRLAPDYVLVRNLGALQYFQDKELKLIGDFSLNVANSVSAKWMLEQKLDRICPSYDLNKEQLLDLLEHLDGRRCEVTVHQYMPAFHMEHCVFAAFLSKGTSYRDCGKPCEKHRVELRDPQGGVHPLKADAECRNTMFNGVPQSAARLIPDLVAKGVRVFRLEALFEDLPTLRTKVEAYLELIGGTSTPDDLYGRLGLIEKYGVSEGQLLNIRPYQDRKKSPQGEEIFS